MAHGPVGEPRAVRRDGNAVDSGLHRCQPAEEDHPFGGRGDDPVLGRYRGVAFEHPAIKTVFPSGLTCRS
jgi:hypothetical protein